MLEHDHKISRRRIVTLVLCGVAVYVLILLGIRFIGTRIEHGKGEGTLGSLENRFDAPLTMELNGRTYRSREKYLDTILFIGVDKRSLRDDGDQRADGGEADFLLLVVIDKQKKRITPIQIDRDTMTEIQIYGAFGDPAGSRTTQICLAQAFGETQSANNLNTVRAVSELLGGIEIKYYLAMDMDGIAKLNDALGGVPVTLEADFSGIDPQMTKGAKLTLRGRQAETYVRVRRAVGDGSNEARMERQRAFMHAAMGVAYERMEQDLNFVGALYDDMRDSLSGNVGRGWLINEAYLCAQYQRGDIRKIAGSSRVGESGYVEFTPDQDALKTLLAETFFG